MARTWMEENYLLQINFVFRQNFNLIAEKKILKNFNINYKILKVILMMNTKEIKKTIFKN